MNVVILSDHDSKGGAAVATRLVEACVKPVEAVTAHLNSIVIRDSAVDAVCHGAPLACIGIAQLDGGGRLIGLEDTVGTRSFVLDLDVEAIHLLDEFNHRQTKVA